MLRASVFLVLFLAVAGAVSHPLTDLPPPMDDVETVYWFPGNHFKQFPAGQVAHVVVGFYNGGAEELNVSAIMGSINTNVDFNQTSIYVQNFTHQAYYHKVGPNEEVSLDYAFMPMSALIPREFRMALTVFYHTDKMAYSSTFFNGTIEITELPSFVDSQLISLYMMVVGLMAAVGYVVYSYLSGFGFMKKAVKKPRKVEAAKNESDASEWLKGTNYKPATKRKPAKSDRKSSE